MALVMGCYGENGYGIGPETDCDVKKMMTKSSVDYNYRRMLRQISEQRSIWSDISRMW